MEENKVVNEEVKEKKKFNKKRVGLLIVAGIAAAIGLGAVAYGKKNHASNDGTCPDEPSYDGNENE